MGVWVVFGTVRNPGGTGGPETDGVGGPLKDDSDVGCGRRRRERGEGNKGYITKTKDRRRESSPVSR